MPNSTIPTYYHYWGKTRSKNKEKEANYHLLPYHCLDVAAVGEQLLSPERSLTQDIAHFLEITPLQLQSLFTFLLALHDIGKFASAFQRLYEHNNSALLQDIPKEVNHYDSGEFRHDRLGLHFIGYGMEKGLLNLICEDQPMTRNTELILRLKLLPQLSNCVLGHHGKPIELAKGDLVRFVEPRNEEAFIAYLIDCWQLLQPQFIVEQFTRKEWLAKLNQVSWHLAGLAVLADWIGSDEKEFSYRSKVMPLTEYWQLAQHQAKARLQNKTFLQQPKICPFLSVQQHYSFEPTPLQHWAQSVSIAQAPQLFILEDITGSGKTEAALTLAHRLMQAEVAEGFYFGLPTMATSNSMFERVTQHYHQMLTEADGQATSIVLAHGASKMHEGFQDLLSPKVYDDRYFVGEESTTAQCHQWLADSRKKALLAPVGVGTIDQALLSVLPRRYQSLRLIGLSRKVLIVDEVHSADEFMLVLLEGLLKLHLHQGGSAILLTATLSQQQRARFMRLWSGLEQLSVSELSDDFPLATHLTHGATEPIKEVSLPRGSTVKREINVVHITRIDACFDIILTAMDQGQCVVWVRNSVKEAQDAFLTLRAKVAHPENILLFHSRFILKDRQHIESLVKIYLGKSSTSIERNGKLIITTQVLQESLDVDTDVMLSDLCPIDDLIQRVGRLHRHTRDSQGKYVYQGQEVRSQPTVYLYAPKFTEHPDEKWLEQDFAATRAVYRSSGRLWLGLKVLLEQGKISIPEQARLLIESVYSEQSQALIPESLMKQEEGVKAERGYKEANAASQLLNFAGGYAFQNGWFEENEQEISTRFSTLSMVNLLLVKVDEYGNLFPYCGDIEFSVELSSVKVPKKEADELTHISAQLIPSLHKLQKRYPQSRFYQPWLIEDDKGFTYDPIMGFMRIKNE